MTPRERAREIFARSLVLAPMTKGSNVPFRRLCRELGADVTVGEMAVARKVVQRRRGELALLRAHADDHPFGAQLADRDPESLARAAATAEEMGSDFVDLNCGCPIEHFTRRGLGAKLLERPRQLARLVQAMRQAVTVPVTVKIRLGWSDSRVNYSEIARLCEAEGADAITLHGRTREQRYSKASDWDAVRTLKEQLSIPVVGNGDLLTHWEIRERWEGSGCDSLMMARGPLIKPWIFQEAKEGRTIHKSPEERLALLERYVALAREHFGDDEYGATRVREFLTWHLNFLCRYRHLPEAEFHRPEFAHPLMQTRHESTIDGDDLEALMARPDRPAHEHLAAIAMGEIERDAPPPPCAGEEAAPTLETSNG